MASPSSFFLVVFLFLCCAPVLCLSSAAGNQEVEALMELKAALDPGGRVLTSWIPGGDPCSPGSFVGVACDGRRRVANLSLQGAGLTGSLSSAIGRLGALSGLYLHYNSLTGPIPPEVSSLAQLAELYLNVNRFSGGIPAELGNMASLQVMQLCYNQLTGGIPTQLGRLPALSVLALQSNRLSGAIPASLGAISTLIRLDLSSNQLFGSIPVKVAQLPRLAVLDVSNNSLSGSVPSELARMAGGFMYSNNSALCGGGFPGLQDCAAGDNGPDPFSAEIPTSSAVAQTGARRRCIKTHCSPALSPSEIAAIVAVSVISFVTTLAGLLALSRCRHYRRTAGSSTALSRAPGSMDVDKDSCRRSVCSLVSVEYSTGWDPLAHGGDGCARFDQDISQVVRHNVEEIESATLYFSPSNLLGRAKAGSLAATYRGVLRDGSAVAVKRLSKTCCRQAEAEFVKGLRLLAALRHDNVVALRGFCSSMGRGECFLVYDFVAGGKSLSKFLIDDADDGPDNAADAGGNLLPWASRVRIVKGIAQGVEYLHKLAVIHQNLSAEKVLIDGGDKPRIAGAGMHKLLADDVVFSVLKSSAAMGYLAPEYATTGRFTEKSDIYAFGVLLLQIVAGKRKVRHLQLGAESGKLDNIVDERLNGEYSITEAAKLAGIALACTAECPDRRPAMAALVHELSIL